MYGSLQVMKKNGVRGEEIKLRDKQITFGRGPQCDILIARKTVSREHARLEIDDTKRIFLTNLSRKGQTWVNFTRVKDGSLEVTDGDVIKIADRSFVVTLLPQNERGYSIYNETNNNHIHHHHNNNTANQNNNSNKKGQGASILTLQTPDITQNGLNLSGGTEIDAENRNPNINISGNGRAKINSFLENINKNSNNNKNSKKSFFSMSTTPGHDYNNNNSNNNNNNGSFSLNTATSKTPITLPKISMPDTDMIDSNTVSNTNTNTNTNTNSNSISMTPTNEINESSKFANYLSPAPKFMKNRKSLTDSKKNNNNSNGNNNSIDSANVSILEARYNALNSASKNRILALTSETPVKSALVE